MVSTPLPDSTHLGYAHLIVADLERSLSFYQSILGLHLLNRNGRLATLSAQDSDHRLLVLQEKDGARPKPPRTTGLYHIALRYSNRIALGQALQRLVETRWPLQGAADHLVSEALYLSDADGLGVELYVDRPRERWPRRGEVIQMATDPLDVRSLLAEAVAAGVGMEASTAGLDLGHIHLQVADLDEARAFYHGLLGFAVMQEDYPGALFLAAGGYHHHIGLNIWAGVGAAAPPSDAVGLQSFSIQLPDRLALEGIRNRLTEQGIEIKRLIDSPGKRGFSVPGPGATELHFMVPPNP
jgi:catechol 2,3-dioxygenase